MNKEIFTQNLNSDRVYNPDEIELVVSRTVKEFAYKTNKKNSYYNIPCSFDIETSSFHDENNNKVAIMYEWTFGINGAVIVGRTWAEFLEMVNTLETLLELDMNRRLVCYVHNLAYEYQFIRKLFKWKKMFALESRKPIKCQTQCGIEFRCSYLLSGYSLAKVGEHLRIYNVAKLIGNLDYSLIRHSGTPMSEAEIAYCVNDVKVVMAYIEEFLENGRKIHEIPATKTGFVREYCRNECFYSEGRHSMKNFSGNRYRGVMRNLTVEPGEYVMLKQAFQGGFTHANANYSGETLLNVHSDDFTSSYPAVMIYEQFPMSKGTLIEIKSIPEFLGYLKTNCCLFEITFKNLNPKVKYENYISLSKCRDIVNPRVNNGRIVSADSVTMTITELDFNIIVSMYNFSSFSVGKFVKYEKNYLPKEFVNSILKLYKDKTELKNVKGKEAEYSASKEMLNSCYGMCVTDIVRPDNGVTEDGEWTEERPLLEDAISKYNKGYNRFLFFPWGVWITAYARRNLFTGIMEFGDDYVYSDTDSIKSINRENHTGYLDKFNFMVRLKLYRAVDYHKLPRELVEPKTIKGVSKLIGVWDYEGMYDKFKTLGAKRYMVEEDGNVNITVSGLNKKTTVPYLVETYGDKIFDAFCNGLEVPGKYTGKNTHTYIDDERTGYVVDYLGNKAVYHEMSAVYMEEAEYKMSLSDEYIDYMEDLKKFY